MDRREVSGMTGGAGIREDEPRVEVAMAKGQAASFQGVVAGIWRSMAIVAFGEMGQGHWIGGRRGMAGAVDAACCRRDISGGDVVHVLIRCGLVLMAVQAIGRVGAQGDNVSNGDGRYGWVYRVDVTGGVVTLAAVVLVVAQDIGPVAGEMAVGALLTIGLAEVGERIDIRRMVDGAAGNAMVMAREVSGVAVFAFADVGIAEGRADTGAVSRRMAGCTAKARMDLARIAKR